MALKKAAVRVHGPPKVLLPIDARNRLAQVYVLFLVVDRRVGTRTRKAKKAPYPRIDLCNSRSIFFVYLQYS